MLKCLIYFLSIHVGYSSLCGLTKRPKPTLSAPEGGGEVYTLSQSNPPQWMQQGVPVYPQLYPQLSPPAYSDLPTDSQATTQSRSKAK